MTHPDNNLTRRNKKQCCWGAQQQQSMPFEGRCLEGLCCSTAAIAPSLVGNMKM
jgi:hypothetical protein